MIEWHCSSRPVEGEEVCGDRAGVVTNGHRAVALAADGLGHGPEAARASERAVALLHATEETDPLELTARCHAALRDTRGAVMGVAVLDESDATVTWLGVGNVEGRVVRAPGAADMPHSESLVNRSGVVGHELPRLREHTMPLRRGDLVLMATDGVDAGFADGIEPTGSCRDIATRILERHGRVHDDALVLALRYLGASQ